MSAQTVTYIHTDALGSVVAETDANGNVIKRYDYEPYGALVGGQVTDGPGYAGHVSDAATGLSYMQQRYMDPQLGVFLSVDPVTAYEQPVGQFNRYRYANGNPYKFKDPDGRIVETAWDIANITFGATSAYSSFAEGNIAAGVVDSMGVAVDSLAAAVPFVPGGAGATIKAVRMAENAAQGARAEKAVAQALGEKVAGQRVTLEASTGQRSVADIVTTDKGVVEVKSGGAQLSSGQKAMKADVEAGRPVTPRGANAEKAGLEPGRPTQLTCYDVKRC
ncbi:hypothetical protein LL963_16090 [Xanthomonas campestris pv. esculenti]|nr:hypothetical protein [Xanthomonas campestris pv. esculenti]